jgi:hypothetical protein
MEKDKMGNIIEPYVTSIITIYNNIKSNYESNLETIKCCEDELNDIYHEIELSTPKNAMEGYKLYRLIRELRLKRRKAKDENELMEEFYSFLRQNVNFKNNVQQIQGNTRKIFDAQQKRTYQPRRRSDLTIAGERCIAYKPFEEMLSDFKQNKISVKNGKLRIVE